MYFASRTQAGRMLASRLTEKYRYENCAVVALDDGGVMVGAQIAQQLHCVLSMLLSSELNLPREPEAVAAISSSGNVAYNQAFSQGEIDELVGEYRGLLEQQKLTRLHEMNRLLSSGGTISRELLRGHNVILVSDGLADGFALDVVYEFLKPIKMEKLVVAVPIATVKAVDRMHVLADDLYCLSVVENLPDINHYYDSNDIPDHESIVKIIEEIVLKWQ